MGRCVICNTSSPFISQELGVCLSCIREKPDEFLKHALRTHGRTRRAFDLPESPPRNPTGISCNLCVNGCKIPEDGWGYCGLRKNKGGKITGVSSEEGKLSWYHDPLPTNCVGDWVCPGGTGAGYPRYAYCPGPEWGYTNLAVFFHACSFNCLSCQNWHFRKLTGDSHTVQIHELVSHVDATTSCICYFGGDPTPQLPFSLEASRRALAANRDRILRICWETNGSMNPLLLDDMISISLHSGGCIKFDLKAWDEHLHIALTGVTNKRTLENFRRAGKSSNKRPIPPLLVTSTLLIPGYIDEDEIGHLATFIASINPDIPYSILAFHPHFYMSDIPWPSRELAYRCLHRAQEAGLSKVRLGNTHLLI